MTSFCRTLAVYETRYVRGRGNVRVLKNTFATYHPRTGVYGLHRNLLPSFLKHLERVGVSESEIEQTVHDSYEPEPINSIKVAAGAKPREVQLNIIDFVIKGQESTTLPVQTGVGKTFCALYSVVQIGVRTAIVMGAMHIDTWCKSADWILEGDTNAIRIVRGKKGLMTVIREAKERQLKSDILIMSVNTLRDYLTEFAKTDRSTYGCDPIDLYETLGVGLRITDEAHESLHFQFRHDIETNVNRSVYLSATIDSNDPFINRMYDVIFPVDQRFTGLEWNKYIDVTAVGYGIRKPETVQCTGSQSMYSHTAFEKWISKDHSRLNNYIELILYVLDKAYISKRTAGDKVAIFLSTVEMCSKVAKRIQDKYPELSCSDYTGSHDSDVLHSHDIVVTTPGSAGTGKDVKGLRIVILTVAIGAKGKNIQILGRLRELSDGVVPEFYYLVARDIPKHVMYHEAKHKLFQGFAKSVKVANTNFNI